VIRALLILTVLGLAVACAESPQRRTIDETSELINRMNRELNGSCNYSVAARNKTNSEMMCVLDRLRSRCNKIDDCYVYCIGNDVGAEVGGGCAHLCNYALREKWEPPEGVQTCQKK